MMSGSAVASTSSATSPGFASRSACGRPLDPDARARVLGAHGSKGQPLLPCRSQPTLSRYLGVSWPVSMPKPGEGRWRRLGARGRAGSAAPPKEAVEHDCKGPPCRFET